MPALPNPKWERFAQCIADGDSAADAYRTAGYSVKNAQAAAAGGSRLRMQKDVAKRIVEISTRRLEIVEKAETLAMGRAVEKLAITRERVITELARLGFADLRKAVKWGTREIRLSTDAELEDGAEDIHISNQIELVNSEDLDADTAAAIVEVKQTNNGVSVKLADKRAALMDLARIMGMVIDRKEVGGAGDFDGMTDNELADIVAGKASAVGTRGTTH